MSKVHIPVAYYQAPDKRLQATQDKLFAALKQHFEAGEAFASISVSALCQTAKIARQTYYQHYDSIGEIIEVTVARVINSALQKADQALDPSDEGAPLTVDLLLAHRDLIAMVRWAHAGDLIVAYLSREIRRVSSIEGTNIPMKGVMIDLLARMYLAFADVVNEHPELSRSQLITIFQKMLPVPAKIFRGL
ncbi:hypothetical protein [Lacticaseibacillus hegangensis]|uniref:HTH tetR-type domain-containing protein n=1 Tax=Lacticaseibacillus hegangensis TaxID=2486010 RepID=A0ABW4D1S0_9LACO|nr:hypothetical protein [Lacticaseibacillus hegangensis]